MSMKPHKRKNPAFFAALADFEETVRLHEMKGCQHPEDAVAIEKAYQKAKEEMTRFGYITVKPRKWKCP